MPVPGGTVSPADGLALLDAIFEHAPIGVVHWDAQARFRRVNDALEEIAGLSREEMVGRHPAELFGPLGQETEAIVRGVLVTGVPVLGHRQHGTLPARPGERDFSVDYLPAVDATGRVVGVVGIVLEQTAEFGAGRERARLLKDALTARAHAEAAQIRAEAARADAEAARARTELLIAAGAHMSASIDYETTLASVAEVAVGAVAEWCVIELAEPPYGELRAVAFAHADPACHAELAAAAERDELWAALKTMGAASALTVPLGTEERRIGTLTLAAAASQRGEEAMGLVEALASRAALHIRNAQLHAERSHIAHTLQASLLPHVLPAVPHLEVAARYQAAGDQNEVGGDFYDVYPGEDEQWWALIGDVTGKGPEAAAITSLARHTLRAGAAYDASPAANLRMLNRMMLADPGSTRFATVACARVVPAEGAARVTLSVGGHPAPLLLRADGELETIEATGTLIGVVPGPDLFDAEVELGAGDLLLLYTDGVTELRTSDPGLGERRLRETVTAHAGRRAEEVLDAVLAAAIDASGGRPRDDIALVALSVRPPV